MSEPSSDQQNQAWETASRLAERYADAIRGKIILTTGASPGGLGAAFVRAVAPHQPALLILAGLYAGETQATADGVREATGDGVAVRTLEVDLGSPASVRAAAKTVCGWQDVPRVDVLVNNAGIVSAAPRGKVREGAREGDGEGGGWDGFETHLATNYLGPFLLTRLLMPKILASDAPRVVNVGSDGHVLSPIRFGDPNFRDESLYRPSMAYGQSKTAQMLTAISLAEKLGAKHNLHAVSVHPGTVTTNLAAHLDWNEAYPEMSKAYRLVGHAQGWKKDMEFLTPDEGAATYVYAAFDDDIKAHNGAYLLKCRLADPWKDDLRAWATSPVEAEMLWKLTEKLIGQEFEY
ncbi:NAD(P)-binding protein [Hypoxylon sp. FL1284]|nr:NAD(P)-binding protein [Hypoxylon sp. FL1284]